MMLIPVRYSFRQTFSVPVQEAFRWSLDYDPNDFSLMELEGRRKINKLSDDTFILEDARRTEEGWVEKTRLIRINHERRSFSNTHIGGPTLHSQFWYEFFPQGKAGSRLEFTGLLLYPSEEELSSGQVAKRGKATRKSGRTSRRRWSQIMLRRRRRRIVAIRDC
jgi:hypothetical protein